MKFKVILHEGIVYQDEVDYAVIFDIDGQFAIMNNHIPIIHSMQAGHIKLIKGNHETFVILEQALVEFKENILSILALDAQIGNTLEQAKALQDEVQKEKTMASKKDNVDFSEKERELRENIKKGRAGRI